MKNTHDANPAGHRRSIMNERMKTLFKDVMSVRDGKVCKMDNRNEIFTMQKDIEINKRPCKR